MTDLTNYRRWNRVSAPRVREHEVIDLRDERAGAPVRSASPEALLAAQLHGLPAGPSTPVADESPSGDHEVIDLRDEPAAAVVDGLPDLTPIQPEGIDGEWERMARAVQTSLAVRAAAKLDAGWVPLGLHIDARS